MIAGSAPFAGAVSVFPAAPPIDPISPDASSSYQSASSSCLMHQPPGPKFDDASSSSAPKQQFPVIAGMAYVDVVTKDGEHVLPLEGQTIVVKGRGVVNLADFLLRDITPLPPPHLVKGGGAASASKLSKGTTSESSDDSWGTEDEEEVTGIKKEKEKEKDKSVDKSVDKSLDKSPEVDLADLKPEVGVSTEAGLYMGLSLDTPLPDNMDAQIQAWAEKGYKVILDDIKKVTPDSIDPKVDELGLELENEVVAAGEKLGFFKRRLAAEQKANSKISDAGATVVNHPGIKQTLDFFLDVVSVVGAGLEKSKPSLNIKTTAQAPDAPSGRKSKRG